MMRSVQSAGLLLLIALVSAPLHAAGPASVGGSVRDSHGTPQIGAVVQLLSPGLAVLATAYTDESGHYRFASIAPGRYAVKAMAASFLPALRDNLHVRANTAVDLTLNTLYEAVRWLPAQPRTPSDSPDEWIWTLRSAANRPLLRWLEDGPLVVVTEGPGSQPRLKARIVATGEEGAFGESGERLQAEVEDTPAGSRELLARVDFAPGSDANLNSQLGFRQDLGMAGSVQSLAAVALLPDLSSSAGEGIEEASFEAEEEIALGDAMAIQAGARQLLARTPNSGSSTLLSSQPWVNVDMRRGQQSLHYGFRTGIPTSAALPTDQLAQRNGHLTIEHGTHQEIGWERRTEASDLSVRMFADRVQDPMLEAIAQLQPQSPAIQQALYDAKSRLAHFAGDTFSSTGLEASYEHRLPGGNQVRISYTNGNSLVISNQNGSQTATAAQVVAGARPHRTQMYALALSGTLEGSGTRWRATYRWQPEDSVTAIAPFSQNSTQPWLNLSLRQPIRIHELGPDGLEAFVKLQNLLAQGYRPVVLGDGSVLIFAQDQRAFTAGLAFNF